MFVNCASPDEDVIDVSFTAMNIVEFFVDRFVENFLREDHAKGTTVKR